MPGPDAHLAHQDGEAALIRQLLDQQSAIQARLAGLLSARRLEQARLQRQQQQQHGFDLPRELGMLRHKIGVLEAVADHHGLSPRDLPILSNIEEARAIQYRCECLEAACSQHCIDVIEPLKLSARSAPPGFAPWLDKHLELHDLVLRQDHSRNQGAKFRLSSLPSLKCWEDHCIHYVYGLSDTSQLDCHIQTHIPYANGNSGSLRSQDPASHHERESPHSKHDVSMALRPSSPVQHPRLSALPKLPPLTIPSSSDHQRESPLSNTLASARIKIDSGFDDAESQSVLPPLKRSRIGEPSRLESIGELRLLRETQQCLRCSISKKECDRMQSCSSCSEIPTSSTDDHWHIVGCFRGSITSFKDILLPGASIWPKQTQTPVIPPLVKWQSVNKYLYLTYPRLGDIARTVKDHRDHADDFWFSGLMSQGYNAANYRPSYGGNASEESPPILCVLAASWNCQETSYNLLELLRGNGYLSSSREVEESAYPLLHRSKLLLREVAFYSILQSDPAVQVGPKLVRQSPVTALDLDDHVRSLDQCTVWFLQSFESLFSRGCHFQPREWLATFYALCLFSVTQTLLVDMLPAFLPNSSSLESSWGNHSQAVHSVYKIVVQMFSAMGPMILDTPPGNLKPDERSAYEIANRVVRRETWPARGIHSSTEFLLHLGSGMNSMMGFNGFIRQRRVDRARETSTATQLRVFQAGQEPLRAPSGAYISSRSKQSLDPRSATSDDLGMSRNGFPGSSCQSPADQERTRRHTVAEAPSQPRSTPQGFGSSKSPLRLPPVSPQNIPVTRVHCGKCTEYPEGFRGDHELRRHTEAKHASLVKRWICTEPDSHVLPHVRPTIPLAGCKTCVTQKHYGAYYNAAAHLRRAHFNPQRGSKASGDWPPMTILKDWMREVRVPIDVDADDDGDIGLSSADEDEVEPKSSTVHSRVYTSETFGAHGLPGASSVGSLTASPNPSDDVGSWTASQRSPLNRPLQPSLLRPQSISPPLSQSRPRPSAGENRSQCPYPDCGRVFKDLAAHMLTHQEERPEKCPIETCEYHTKGFARKYDKNRHALTHYRGTMVCPFCPGVGSPYAKAFNRADVLKRHLATAHQVEQAAAHGRSGSGSGSSGSHTLPGSGVVSATTSTLPGAAGGTCSICVGHFGTPQEFYLHLDDCVLSVLVPTGGRIASKTTPIMSTNTMK